MTKAVGKTIRGRSVSSVFGDVPRADYIDSLLTDISDSPKKTEAFGYAVLSLCRTLAFLREDRIVSKLEGGHWALKNLPKEYVPVVAAALDEYIYGIPFSIPEEEAEKFFRDMRARLPN